LALGPLCGIEIRLVHLSTCDEAGPATSGRPGDGPALGVKDPILPRAANSVVRFCTYSRDYSSQSSPAALTKTGGTGSCANAHVRGTTRANGTGNVRSD
jgi:hypothetical protein